MSATFPFALKRAPAAGAPVVFPWQVKDLDVDEHPKEAEEAKAPEAALQQGRGVPGGPHV